MKMDGFQLIQMKNFKIMSYKKILMFIIMIFIIPTKASPKVVVNSDWVFTEMANFRLISGISNIGASNKVPLGLEFELRDGWKIYWRNPGDAGYPPEISFSNSENLSELKWYWPAPKRFVFEDMQNFGYEEKIIFPITAILKKPKEPLVLRAHITALACKDICVPIDRSLNLTIPVGHPVKTDHAASIYSFEKRVPTKTTWPGFNILSVGANKNSILIEVKSKHPLIKPDIFIESESVFRFEKPEISVSNDRLNALFVLSNDIPIDTNLAETPITITVVDGKKSIELRRSISAKLITKPVQSYISFNWLTVLLAALIGGLILNLMPCVLPVLTIKLLQVTRSSGLDRRGVRNGFIYSAYGVMFSFLVIAILTIILKQVGVNVGWGMHFQQPVFLGFICLILLAFAGNLFGWLNFQVPQSLLWLENRSASLINLEEKNSSKVNHFFTGAFATVLATPCSAPFVGTALSFALSQGPIEILSIFLTMGLGLSLPYLLIAIRPEFLKFLPRPGTWMKKLEIFLGIVLIFTTIWILSILYSQLNTNSFIISLTLITSAFVTAGAFHLSSRGYLKSLSALMGVSALFIMAYSEPPSTIRNLNRPLINILTTGEKIIWQDFNPDLIPDIVKDGKGVFVDITADWCLTCQINKRTLLSNELVKESLSDNNVIKMQADWTLPDPTILSYLESYNRFGIPFNVIYGPANLDGIVLPELLSESSVLKAFKDALGPENIFK